jgi:hypothetical protein
MSHLFRFVSILISYDETNPGCTRYCVDSGPDQEDFQGRLTHSYITSHNLTPLKACRSKYIQNKAHYKMSGTPTLIRSAATV